LDSQRLGMALADWSQRWFPDAFVFAPCRSHRRFQRPGILGIATRDLVKYFGTVFGASFRSPMQMAIIISGG